MDTRLPQGFQKPFIPNHLKAQNPDPKTKGPDAWDRGYALGKADGYREGRESISERGSIFAGVFMGAFGMACIWLVVGLLR